MDMATSIRTIQSFFATYGVYIGGLTLLPMILYGIFTAKLAAKKGYRGYFFTGFFFHWIGLLYVVGLPLARDCAVPARKRIQN